MKQKKMQDTGPSRWRKMIKAERGVVLIMAVGVLAILAVLAATLSAVARLELQAASAHMIPMQAREAAMAGIQHAIDEIMSDGDATVDWIGDSNGSGDNWVTAFEPGGAYSGYSGSNPTGAWVDIDGADPYLANGEYATYRNLHYYNLNKYKSMERHEIELDDTGVDNKDTLSRWFVMRDANNKPIGRYAVLVTDCQGKINMNDWIWDNMGMINAFDVGAGADRRTNYTSNLPRMQTPHRATLARMMRYIRPPHKQIYGTSKGKANFNTQEDAIMRTVLGSPRASTWGQSPSGPGATDYTNIPMLFYAPFGITDVRTAGRFYGAQGDPNDPDFGVGAITWRNYFRDLTVSGIHSPIGARGIVTPFAYTVAREDYTWGNYMSSRGYFDFMKPDNLTITAAAMQTFWTTTWSASLGENPPYDDPADKKLNLLWMLNHFRAYPHFWRNNDNFKYLWGSQGVGAEQNTEYLPPRMCLPPTSGGGAIGGSFTQANFLQMLTFFSALKNDLYKPAITHRSPININTAPARVLAGVLLPDKSRYLMNVYLVDTGLSGDLSVPLVEDQMFHTDGRLLHWLSGGWGKSPGFKDDALVAGNHIRHPWKVFKNNNNGVVDFGESSLTYSLDRREMNSDTGSTDYNLGRRTPSIQDDYQDTMGYHGWFGNIPEFSKHSGVDDQFADVRKVIDLIIANRPFNENLVGSGGPLKDLILGASLPNTTSIGKALLIDNFYGDTANEYRAMKIWHDLESPTLFDSFTRFPFQETKPDPCSWDANPTIMMSMPVDLTGAVSTVTAELSGLTLTTEFCANSTMYEIIVVGQATDPGVDPNDPGDDIPLSEVTYHTVINRDPDGNGTLGVTGVTDGANEYDVLYFGKWFEPQWPAIRKFARRYAKDGLGVSGKYDHHYLEDMPGIYDGTMANEFDHRTDL